MTVSETHTQWGEIFGVFAWVWFFHRARHDLPVVLGWRRPWDHAEDPFEPHVHALTEDENSARKEGWDVFGAKALKFGDDDDDEEEEDEDDDDDE